MKSKQTKEATDSLWWIRRLVGRPRLADIESAVDSVIPDSQAPSERDAAVVVNHSNTTLFDSVAPDLLERVGRMRLFLTHASVGRNILEGIARLAEEDPDRYRLKVTEASIPGSSGTDQGTLYHRDRGNPGAAAKVRQFADLVNSGWYFPQIDVAINKFCYIDSKASLGSYVASMDELQARHAGTVFVYVTIPLTARYDAANVYRHIFNERLRTWITANRKVLLDLADIENYTQNGAPCSFPYEGLPVPSLCPEYTNDGGHLNALGQQVVSKSLYSLLALLAPALPSVSG